MGGKSNALKEGMSLIDEFISAIKGADKTPIVPAPNRWFAKPDEYPHVQPMVEKALAASGMGRQDFPFGAYIDPRTGEVLTNRMMDEVGVLIDPKTGRPMMSGKPSGMESFEDLSKALGSQTQSNLVRRSIFKPTGGDSLLDKIPFVATVERGPHFYGLGTEYASPTQLFQIESGSNPHLRPKSRGDVFGMGDVVGRMQIGKGPEHDVYEKLFVAPRGSDVPGKKLSKAKGGAIKKGLGLVDDFLKDIAKPAAKPKAVQEVVSTAERDANLAKFLEQSKVKERLYRGAVGFEPSGMPEGFLNAEPREGYAVFASTNPAIANTYAMPEHEDWGGKMIGAVTPLHVQAKRLIEFPNFEKAPNFDKFEFDRWAQNLKPGEVLVVRNVTDTGPRSTYKVDPQKLHTYGSDIYAWNKGTSAKSATGNRGTYDPKDPDITKAKGGEVHMMGGGNPKPSNRPLSEALLALGDIIGGATRGGVKEFLGTPGDLESLVRERGLGLPANVLRLLMPTRQGKETTLPTSEDFDQYLPPVVPKGAENYDERARTAGIAQTLGELNPVVPLSYSAAAKGAVKGAKAAGKGALSLAKSEPARRAVERTAEMTGTAPMNVVKNKGGNWIDTGLTPITRRIEISEAEDLERNLAKERELYDQAFRNRGADDFWTRHYADNLKMLEANLAERRFADKNLVNYMRNQMGTEDDPIRKAIDEGYYHFELPAYDPTSGHARKVRDKRLSLGFPPQGSATTPAGKSWEDIVDMAINPEPAAYRLENDIGSFEGSLLERNPWLAKVSPEEQIYSLNRYTRPMDLGFDELLKTLNEEVLAGRIDPMNVKTIKMDDLVRLTHKRELDRQAELRRTMAANRKDLPVFKEYPEGYKWVELNKPGSFATESDAMQHSVRGYEPLKGDEDWIDLSGNSGQSTYGHGGWEAIKSGKAKVYSLVDETGQPHVTVETVNPSNQYTEDDIYEQFPGGIHDALRRGGPNAVDEYIQAKIAKHSKPIITQIKRKGNVVDTEEYPQRKYVQDLVRNGNFGKITQDLENTGLVKRSLVFTPKEKQDLIERGYSVPKYLTSEEVQTLTPIARATPESYFQKPPPSTPEPDLNVDFDLLNPDQMKSGGLAALRKRHGKG